MDTGKYVRSDNFVSTDMDGEIVMMSIEHGSYFGISGAGTLIWDMLEQPQSKAALVEGICAKYEVTEEAARADVNVFLSKLAENNLTRSA